MTVVPQQVVYVEHPSNTPALVGLVFGLVGVALGLVPLFFALAWAGGLVALVLGIMGRRRAKAEGGLRSKMAAWSIVLSIVAFALGGWGYSILASL